MLIWKLQLAYSIEQEDHSLQQWPSKWQQKPHLCSDCRLPKLLVSFHWSIGNQSIHDIENIANVLQCAIYSTMQAWTTCGVLLWIAFSVSPRPLQSRSVHLSTHLSTLQQSNKPMQQLFLAVSHKFTFWQSPSVVCFFNHHSYLKNPLYFLQSNPEYASSLAHLAVSARPSPWLLVLLGAKLPSTMPLQLPLLKLLLKISSTSEEMPSLCLLTSAR